MNFPFCNKPLILLIPVLIVNCVNHTNASIYVYVYIYTYINTYTITHIKEKVGWMIIIKPASDEFVMDKRMGGGVGIETE